MEIIKDILDANLKVSDVNQTCYLIIVGSLEVKPTVPLKLC